MPDISLLKSLCDELGITINELLSGMKVTNNNIEKVTNDNLENILNEYYKMKRHKRILKISLFILGISFLLLIFYISFILGINTLFNTFGDKEIITDISKYNKNYYIKKYSNDLDSNLSIFPHEISNDMSDIEFESNLSIGLLDTDGYIYLKYKLDEEKFYKEIERIKQIKITIEDNKDNIIKYLVIDIFLL